MNRAAACCLPLLLAAVSPLAAVETREFPEALCSYTLPSEDWEWVDPDLAQLPGGKTIAFARNRKGMAFTLRFDHVKATEKPDARSYESFEVGLLKSGRMTKLGSSHITFKGLPSYQIDVQTPKGQGAAIRILYANQRFYHLQVVNGFGPLGPDADADPIFGGFNFTGQPQPMLPSGEVDASFERGQAAGRAVLILLGVGVVVLLVAGLVVLVVFLSVGGKWKDQRRH